MTKEELKAEHPALYASIVAEGVSEERDRVSAHLQMGEGSGDMDTAIKAISEGTGFTSAIQATYMAAGMKKKETELRGADNVDLDTDDTGDSPAAQADIVASKVEELCGMPEGGK